MCSEGQGLILSEEVAQLKEEVDALKERLALFEEVTIYFDLALDKLVDLDLPGYFYEEPLKSTLLEVCDRAGVLCTKLFTENTYADWFERRERMWADLLGSARGIY